jgi:GT2 family glycosyltransferase
MNIALVVLNYNGCALLDECLASLRRLTVPAEIIVADNGSTDDSLAHLRAHHPDVRVLTLKKNWGFAEGYNRALAQVTAPWVALLNNDALPEPDWLAQLLAAAERHPRAAILGGKLLFGGLPAERGRVVQCAGTRFTTAGTAFEIGWGQPDGGQYDAPTVTASIPGAALLIKRAVFVELGGFDPDYIAFLEDVDLCWRAWLAGHEMWYEPSAVAFHGFGSSWGGRASPRRIELMQRNRLANMVKLLEPPSLLGGLAVSDRKSVV